MMHSIFCYFVMLSSISSLSSGQIIQFGDEMPEAIKDSKTVTKLWKKFETEMKDLVNRGIKLIMPTLMDNMNGANISTSCVRDAMYLVGGLKKLKTWAVTIVDSTAKSTEGLLTGTISFFGAYDQCIDTVVINQRSGKHKGEVMFTGKYCILRIKPSLPPRKPVYNVDDVIDELQGIYPKDSALSKAAKYAAYLYEFPIQLGLCVPSGCSVDDINQVFAKVSNMTDLYMKVKDCEVKEEIKITPVMIFVMFMFSFAGFMVLLGTLVDVYCYYSERKPNHISVRVALAFSFMSNFRKLTNTSSSVKSLRCLNGIRFITMSWIILAHSYIMAIRHVVGGFVYVQSMVREFVFQVVMNGFLAVDTFFFLGGFLVCYISTKYVKFENGTFIIGKYILHRLWRILPIYIFVIMFEFLRELLNSGPIARSTNKVFLDGCRENWWLNLLFIHNYVHTKNMCLPHTYYISLDMQFYIGAVIILLPLFRWPKIGISIAVVTVLASMVGSAVVTYMRNFPPTQLLASPNLERITTYVTDFYNLPYPHCGPYAIGMLTGYLLAMRQNLKIPKVVQLLGWSCSVAVSLLVIYGTYEWNRGREATVWETVLYSGCHRVAWTLSVAWMVICCATGHGGVVNYILSFKIWIPLGRLTFIAYLVHPIVQTSVIGSARHTFNPQHSVGVWIYFGHLMATYGAAFAGSMLIESPCLALEKLIRTPHDEKTSDKSVKDSHHALDVMEVVKGDDPQLIDGSCTLPETYCGVQNSAFVCKL